MALKKISALVVCPLVLHAQAWTRLEAVEPHMGTLVRITLYARDSAGVQSAFTQAFNRIGQLDQTLSDYIASSELNQLRCGAALPVSPDLFAVVHAAQQISIATGGVFDVTIGPLVRLWRQARAAHRAPDPSQIAMARALTGFRLLRLDPAAQTIEMLRCGMRLDLGGIGKGYAAAEALRTLQRAGYPRALVAIGGDIAIGSPPPGRKAWRIEAQDQLFELARCSVSTSGDSEQFAIIGGVRYSHAIDPKTGIGALRTRPATVIAGDGAAADALATALHLAGEPLLPVVKSMRAKAVLGAPTMIAPAIPRSLGDGHP